MSDEHDWEVVPCRTRECRQPIVFVKVSASHKPMPIEWSIENNSPKRFVDNGTAGRVQRLATLDLDLDDGYLRMVPVRVLTKGEPADPDSPIWLSHFVTCPGSEDWRKKQ